MHGSGIFQKTTKTVIAGMRLINRSYSSVHCTPRFNIPIATLRNDGYFLKCHCHLRRRNLSTFSQVRYLHSEKEHSRNVTRGRSTASIISRVTLGIAILFGFYKWHKFRNTKSIDSLQETHKDIHCKGSSGKLIRHGQFWLPTEFFGEVGKLDKIKNFPIREDDVVVSSFPKSGTTWLQEIVYLIINGVAAEPTSKATIEERFPYIEYIYPGLDGLTRLNGQRLMKTHLPFELLPRDILSNRGKLIYIARNPKDVSVSYYHFIRMLTYTDYKGQFYDFYTSFREGKVPYGPWTSHVEQYWREKQKNMLFITYETLHKDSKGTIRKIGEFLGRNLSDEQVEIVAKHCHFSNMRDNPMVNYSWWTELGISKSRNTTHFMRKGKVGDWTNYYSEEMSQDVDRMLLEPLSRQGLVMDEGQ